MLSPLYAGPSLLDEANNARERVRNRGVSITIKPPRGRRASPSQDLVSATPPSLRDPPLNQGEPPATSSDFSGFFRSNETLPEAWREAVHLGQTFCGIAEFSPATLSSSLAPACFDTAMPTLLIDCWRDDVAAGYAGSLDDWAALNI